MIPSFTQYLVEEEKVVFFTFGRMNPPTIGHGKLLDKLASAAGRHPYKVFLSQSQDTSKNPLSYIDKVKHVRKMFPKHARSVMGSKNIRTVFDVAVELHKLGFRRVVMVVGADRVLEFDTMLTKYNGIDARHGFYHFASIKVVSAGDRDPDAEGAEGASATKQRKFAHDNDFTSFAQGVPSTLSTKDTRKLFNDVRRGMGLQETSLFKNHIQLNSVNNTREQYIKGSLFAVGDQVIIKGTEEVANVVVLGSNYVIVETAAGRLRKWLNDVEIIEQTTDRWHKDQSEWGTPESSEKVKQTTPGQSENKALGIGIRQLQRRLKIARMK